MKIRLSAILLAPSTLLFAAMHMQALVVPHIRLFKVATNASAQPLETVKAIIHFTGTGLKPEAVLQGFTIAGADGTFVPAVPFRTDSPKAKN